MKKIVIKTDNGISIMHPVIALKECLKTIPKGTDYKIVDESEILKDRTFRDAWGYDLKEDIGKSKEIWKEKLREERKPILEALDIDYTRALEENTSTLNIIEKKKKLRDITKHVDKAKTIEEIKAVKL